MDGALIIDKPAGWTSHDVVARVRKVISVRRVGHTGTLDPFATGVLVILAGRATRLAQFLSGAEKEYEADIRLGYATDTGDLTGARVSSVGAPDKGISNVQSVDLEAAMAALRGEIEQTPPMYSAKKIAGQKLYELARRGEEVERQPVRVTVSQFQLLDGPRRNEDGTQDLKVRVVCSAGTYVRVLAEDLGKRLEVGAHLAALRRTRAGQMTIDRAVELDRLAELAASDSIGQVMISPDMALSHLPVIDLSEAEAQCIVNGIDLPLTDALPQGTSVRLREVSGNLLAVGSVDSSRNVIHPQVVIG